MLAKTQLSIEDLLGQISKRFIEQLLVLSAEQVAGAKHPGRRSGDVRWHGTQAGQVSLGKAKLKVKLQFCEMEQLRDQGLDLNEPRLWVIDGSKTLASSLPRPGRPDGTARSSGKPDWATHGPKSTRFDVESTSQKTPNTLLCIEYLPIRCQWH